MKVGETITLYAGARTLSGAAAEDAAGEREKRKTVFAGDLNQDTALQDKILRKKAEAQKQAMKAVEEVWGTQREIDEDLESRRDHVRELKEEKNALGQEAEGVARRFEELEKAYETGEVSEAEYRAEKQNLLQEQKAYNQKISENESEIVSENAVVRGTRQELLKTPYEQSMGGAWDRADAIMDAAGEEIIGMAVDAAKEHIDEETQKREEQAEAAQEKKEEQEEIRDKQEEQEKQAEELADSVPLEEMVSMDKLQDEVKQEVADIVDKLKLLAEDIKGAVVDKSL